MERPSRGLAGPASTDEGMERMRLPEAELVGNAYEHGYQHGRAFAGGIAANLKVIRNLVETLAGGRPGWYESLLERNKAYLVDFDPDTVQELEGLAAGAAISERDALVMNLPIYTLLRRTDFVEECSIFAVPRPLTADGVTYLVKTRDQNTSDFEFNHVVLKRRYPDGQEILEVTAAGIVTNPGSGLNKSGFAVGTAGAWSRKRLRVDLGRLANAWAMPDMHWLLRRAETVADACRLLASVPRLAGMNLVVADAQGDVGTLEVTPNDMEYTAYCDEVACLTNHYVTPRFQPLNDDPDENPSSHARYARIRSFFGERAPEIGFRDLLHLLADHSGGSQNSVCRHASKPGESNTNYASVATIEDREAWSVAGNPCQAASVASMSA